MNIEYHFPLEGSSGQLTVIKIQDATPGIWTVTMYGDIVLDGRFDAWLPIMSFIPEGVEFLSATPYTTITVPATMYGAISCGSYDYTNNSLYSRSSWEPTRTLSLDPEIVAPGLRAERFHVLSQHPMGMWRLESAADLSADAGDLIPKQAEVHKTLNLRLFWGFIPGFYRR